MPTPNDVSAEINGSAWFSILDMNKAFHQLELDEESREIGTFSTHIGNFRYKRLNMGICSATEIFQHVMESKVMNGLKGAKNIHDDILVHGKSEEEHDRNLMAVLERLEERGITLNLKKWQL